MTDENNFDYSYNPQENNNKLNLMRSIEEEISDFLVTEYNAYNRISATKLIKATLHNSYKLTEDVFELKLTPQELHERESHKITGNITNERLSKTVENHVHDFLNKSIDSVDKTNIPYKISKEIKECKGNKESTESKEYTNYYITYFDSIIMLLFFIFQDGRIFKTRNRNDERLPPFKKYNSCSISAYKYVIQEVFRLFPEASKIDKSSINNFYEVVQLYRIDKTLIDPNSPNCLYEIPQLYRINKTLINPNYINGLYKFTQLYCIDKASIDPDSQNPLYKIPQLYRIKKIISNSNFKKCVCEIKKLYRVNKNLIDSDSINCLYAIAKLFRMNKTLTDKNPKNYLYELTELYRINKILINPNSPNCLYTIAQLDRNNKILNDKKFRNCVYEISQLYRIDKTFQMFRLNRFAIHHNKFLAEENLERIYNCFKFKYNEVINLKETLKKEIFYNKEFIKLCFNSKHLDPMAVFITYFEKYLNIYSLSKNTQYTYFDNIEINIEKYTFAELISFCKMKTKEYFESLAECDFSKMHVQNMECYFDKPEADLEDDVKTKLDCRIMYNILMNHRTDRFEYSVYDYYPWYNYYFANRELLEKFSKSSKYDKSYLTYLFETIKEFLPKSLF